MNVDRYPTEKEVTDQAEVGVCRRMSTQMGYDQGQRMLQVAERLHLRLLNMQADLDRLQATKPIAGSGSRTDEGFSVTVTVASSLRSA